MIVESADSFREPGERAFTFPCEGETLLGVVTLPPRESVDLGVLIVVGGPQYRAGSHRHFVRLSRDLAAAGWPAMRFDVRGMGDSSGDQRSFEQLTPDIGAAIDAFQRQVPGLRRVVLWGLCDAASAALLYVDERDDARLGGLVLLNPWVRAPQTHARAQVRGYYARRLVSADLWRGLLRGQVKAASIADFARTTARALRRRRSPGEQSAALPYQTRMARGWQRFSGPTLLVLSGRDLTADEFEERLRVDVDLARALGRASVTTSRLHDADHTLSDRHQAQTHLGELTNWLRAVLPVREERT